MNFFSLSEIKKLLQKYNAAPLKRLGQNFLINRGVLEKIIEAAEIDREDIILEIGPGLGTLTRALAKRAKKVVAIEKDRKFVEILKELIKDYKNVEIIGADILKLENKEIDKLFFHLSSSQSGKNYKLVANLPYNIASAVIKKFLEAERPPEEMILMLQKEVAQRICAKPPKMSLLAVATQFYAEPKILFYVSRGSFWPQPKVDSAVLRLAPHKISKYRNIGISKFFWIVRAGFSAPRKQLAGNLTKKLKIERSIIEQALKKSKINPGGRPQTLVIDDWLNLTSWLKPYLNENH